MRRPVTPSPRSSPRPDALLASGKTKRGRRALQVDCREEFDGSGQRGAHPRRLGSGRPPLRRAICRRCLRRLTMRKSSWRFMAREISRLLRLPRRRHETGPKRIRWPRETIPIRLPSCASVAPCHDIAHPHRRREKTTEPCRPPPVQQPDRHDRKRSPMKKRANPYRGAFLRRSSAASGWLLRDRYYRRLVQQSDEVQAQRPAHFGPCRLTNRFKPDPALNGTPLILPAPYRNTEWAGRPGGYAAQCDVSPGSARDRCSRSGTQTAGEGSKFGFAPDRAGRSWPGAGFTFSMQRAARLCV